MTTTELQQRIAAGVCIGMFVLAAVVASAYHGAVLLRAFGH